jgi:phosphoglucomutase
MPEAEELKRPNEGDARWVGMIGWALWSAISRTGDIYKIYAESFRGDDHLRRVLEVAQTIVSDASARAP